MRNIVTISIPPSLKKNVEYMMKERNYASVSELFRDSIRSLEEDLLIKNIIESEREFSLGKGKRLRSLRDLI
jgi:Arc/MetJ-type ribon-helix-helix transcriptional regulator